MTLKLIGESVNPLIKMTFDYKYKNNLTVCLVA
jgi:hypothetical protein